MRAESQITDRGQMKESPMCVGTPRTMTMQHAMSDKLQFVAGVALVETHDKLKLVGHFLRRGEQT